MHFQYIDKHGVDEFVDYCEDIVKRERAVVDEKRAQKMQVDLRNDYSMLKLHRANLDLDERMRDNKIAIRKSRPFSMDLPVDIRRDDHKDHQKPKRLTRKEKEDEFILDRLEKIKWLKDKSMLDLSELIRKHSDRQPELLAMLQPDIKRQIVHDPALLKSME